ncbi:hypothetical protein L9F63_010250, partial [Diploptera punctata]
LLAATCGGGGGGGVEVNNNNSNSKDTVVPQRHQQQQCHQGTTNRCQQCHTSTAAPPLNKLQHQQPAVGVAAVAPSCTSCRPGFLHPHTSQPAYQRILQQPWAGMTAASATHYQQPALAAVPSSGSKTRGGGRAVEPGPEHAASSLHHVHVRRSVPWARTTSTGAVKRSRTSHTQETWVVQPQYPADTAARTGWNAQQTNTKDPVCKACCHPPQTAVAPPPPPDPQQQQPIPQQQQQQPQQQPQWGSYYGVTGHCRGASEDGSRILWNNENMLRLFQV